MNNPRYKQGRPEYSSLMRFYERFVLRDYKRSKEILIQYDGKMHRASASGHRTEKAFKMRKIWRLMRLGKND